MCPPLCDIRQIRGWLEAAGFALEAVYGDYEWNPVSERTNRLILWARKK